MFTVFRYSTYVKGAGYEKHLNMMQSIARPTTNYSLKNDHRF